MYWKNSRSTPPSRFRTSGVSIPMRKQAYTFSAHCLQEVTSDAVSTADSVIRVALEEIFRGL